MTLQTSEHPHSLPTESKFLLCLRCLPPEHLLEATQTSQISKTSIILYVRDYFLTISCKLTGENPTEYKISLNRSYYTYFSVSEALINKKSRVKLEQSDYLSTNHELTGRLSFSSWLKMFVRP